MREEHEALRDALMAAEWMPSTMEAVREGLAGALEETEAMLIEHESEFPAAMDMNDALDRADLIDSFESVGCMLEWLDATIVADANEMREEVQHA